MKIVVTDPDDAKIIVKTGGLQNPAFKLRVAPKVDNNTWTKNSSIVWKDGKGFPVGADNAAVVLKWRFTSDDDHQIPITLNFWSNVEDGRTVVTVDYSAEKPGLTFQSVHIIIPCKAKELPQVSNADGSHHYDNKEKSLVWTIDEISESKNKGSLEFSVPEVDPDIFYPISILFTSPQTYADIQVEAVVSAESGKEVGYQYETSLGVEKYTVE